MAGLFSQREGCRDVSARSGPEYGLARGCGTDFHVFRDEISCV